MQLIMRYECDLMNDAATFVSPCSLAPAEKRTIVSSCSYSDLDSDHDHQRQLARKRICVRATRYQNIMINVRPTFERIFAETIRIFIIKGHLFNEMRIEIRN